MTGEIAFFKLGKERDELIREIAENLIAASPECADAREALEYVRRELKSLELSLVQKIEKDFVLLQGELLKLVRELAGALYEAGFESHAKRLLELCEKLSAYTQSIECLRYPESIASLLDSVEELLEILSLSCPDSLTILRTEGERSTEQVRKICSKIKEHPGYQMLVRDLRSDIYLRRKLKGAERAIEKVENYREDYATLRKLAAAYQFYRAPAISSPVKVFNIVASESKAAYLLWYLREEVNTDEVDLVEAFKYLEVLEEMLKERLNIRGILEELSGSFYSRERLYKIIPALLYILAQVANIANLRELLEELVKYIETALTVDERRVSSTWEERFLNLLYDLAKILALVLCLNGRVDWRLAAAFAISAAKHWVRWDEESSFIDLCSGLRALHNFTTKEEAERILTYAALYGDYDLIVKLHHLLWARSSLSSANPLR
ncbi:MAG: hypothetical protein QW448_04545 [Thermofilaceae archaeon]